MHANQFRDVTRFSRWHQLVWHDPLFGYSERFRLNEKIDLENGNGVFQFGQHMINSPTIQINSRCLCGRIESVWLRRTFALELEDPRRNSAANHPHQGGFWNRPSEYSNPDRTQGHGNETRTGNRFQPYQSREGNRRTRTRTRNRNREPREPRNHAFIGGPAEDYEQINRGNFIRQTCRRAQGQSHSLQPEVAVEAEELWDQAPPSQAEPTPPVAEPCNDVEPVEPDHHEENPRSREQSPVEQPPLAPVEKPRESEEIQSPNLQTVEGQDQTVQPDKRKTPQFNFEILGLIRKLKVTTSIDEYDETINEIKILCLLNEFDFTTLEVLLPKPPSNKKIVIQENLLLHPKVVLTSLSPHQVNTLLARKPIELPIDPPTPSTSRSSLETSQSIVESDISAPVEIPPVEQTSEVKVIRLPRRKSDPKSKPKKTDTPSVKVSVPISSVQAKGSILESILTSSTPKNKPNPKVKASTSSKRSSKAKSNVSFSDPIVIQDPQDIPQPQADPEIVEVQQNLDDNNPAPVEPETQTVEFNNNLYERLRDEFEDKIRKLYHGQVPEGVIPGVPQEVTDSMNTKAMRKEMPK